MKATSVKDPAKLSQVQLKSGRALSAVTSVKSNHLTCRSVNSDGIFSPRRTLKTSGVQTDFRENGTQTDPWTPRYRVMNGRPEVLTLGFMKTKRDLPAWRRTVDAIEFMRKKRAWEKYLAKTFTPEEPAFSRRIITDIEKCERQLIEDDFDRRNKKRLELAQKEAEYFNYVMDQRFKERDQFVSKEIAKRKVDKIRAIKAKKARELRKIDMRQRGVNMKYHHLTPIEEMCDPLSPFHVSIARFGKNPRYATEVLDPECAVHDMNAFRACDQIREARQRRALAYETSVENKTRPKRHDCSVFTDITFEEAVQPTEYHGSSQSTDKLFTNSASLNELELMKSTSVPYFPTPHQEKDYQAVLLLQTLIRGRAVQNVMYKGRKLKQSFIKEIQSTMAFFKEEEDEVDLRRRRALQRLRYYHLNMKLMGLVALVRDDLMSEGISALALKSHLEVERATEEMRGYLMAQLAERTRWHREAAESGRRQRELRRRELYDEFFKHLTRRNEITSEFYMSLIQDRVCRAIAEKEAHIATRQKADEIEKKDIEDARRAKHDIVTRRETMARLLHDFYVPQIAKNLERFSMDYYIQKARKTAIDVITDRARKYNMDIEETSLMELVNRPKHTKPYEAQVPLSASDLDSSSALVNRDTEGSIEDDDEDEELAEKIKFLEEFWKKDTMSVMKEASLYAKQAEYYKKLIMKKLKAQEDERRLTHFAQPLPTDGNEVCFKHVYDYDLKLQDQTRAPSADPVPEVFGEEMVEEEMKAEEEAKSESKTSSFDDYIDRRLLVNSDEESTTASESEDEKNASQLYGDMPEKLIDELLMQGQVLDAMGREKVDIVELLMKTDALSLDSYDSYGVIDDSKDETGATDAQPSVEPSVQAKAIDPDQLAGEAQRKYQEWRDQSDMSRLDWGYHAPSPTDSEGDDRGSVEGLETYPAGYEGEEQLGEDVYDTQESTEGEGESEETQYSP